MNLNRVPSKKKMLSSSDLQSDLLYALVILAFFSDNLLSQIVLQETKFSNFSSP